MASTFATICERRPGMSGWIVEHVADLLHPSDLAARAAATPTTAGIYLEVDDSDTWSVLIYAQGQVIVSVQQLPLPAAQAAVAAPRIVAAARAAFGIELDEQTVREALEATAVFAEDAMADFASLLGIEDARRGSPSAAATSAAVTSSPRPAPTAFDVHLHASLSGPLAEPVVDYVGHVAHVLGGGRGGGGWWYASTRRGDRTVDARGSDTRAVERISAVAEAGDLALLTVQLDSATITCEPDPGELHVLAPALLAADGAANDAGLAALLLGDVPALHEALFAQSATEHGYATTVPIPDPDGAEALAIRAWPPYGHWLDYLSAPLVDRCGGRDHVTRALSEWTLCWQESGSVTAQMPVAPHEAADPAVAPLRERLHDLLAGAGL